MAKQPQSKERNKRKKLDTSIELKKYPLDFLTNYYYQIKMNNKYIIFLRGDQGNKLYIYNVNTCSTFIHQLKESINYFNLHKNYESIFCVAVGNDILIYNIDINTNMINEISKIKGHFSKVIYTEFSPYNPYILLSICDNNDIKIFEINKVMPKNHIYFEQELDTIIKWTKNNIGALSQDRKTIFISSQHYFTKKDVWEKKFDVKIKDFHFYDDNNEEYIIVLTKKDVIFVTKGKEKVELIYEIREDIDFNYSFYFKSKKLLIIFGEIVLIGLIMNYSDINNVFEKKMDKNHYTLFFYDEKSLENNEICKFYNIEAEHINLFSVNLDEYGIKIINDRNTSDIEPINKFLKKIVNNIYDIGYVISKYNNNEVDNKYIYDKKYFSYKEIEEELNKVKELDLFKRKDKVNEALKVKDKENISEIDLIDNKKNKYIYILKLLVNDNTNKKLIIKYLDFLKDNKEELNKICFDIIEKFDNELKYYLNILNREEAKRFGEDKKNGKDKLIDVFDELLKFNEDNIVTFENYLNNLDDPENDIIYYNMPIDYDNEELLFYEYYYLIKIYLIELKDNIVKKIKFENLEGNEKKTLLNTVLEILIPKITLTRDYIKENPSKKLIIRLLINLTVKSCDISEFELNYNLLTSKEIINEDDIKKFEKDEETDSNDKYKKDDKSKNLCLTNTNKSEKENDYSNFDYYLNKHKDEYHFEIVKKFYKNILPKECFKSLYINLFGGDYYPFSDQEFTNKFIDKYFNFIPMKSQEFSGLTEKLTLITDILTFLPEANYGGKIEKKILKQGLIIINGNHEFGHNFININFYNENARITIKTPRKKTWEISEGGTYIDYALYGRTLKFLNLKQALYVMNEDNYDKNFLDFQKGFNNIQQKDLEIKGEFAKVFENKNFDEIYLKDKKNIYLSTKSLQNEEIRIDCKIRHDVVGRIIPEEMYEKIYQNENEFN